MHVHTFEGSQPKGSYVRDLLSYSETFFKFHFLHLDNWLWFLFPYWTPMATLVKVSQLCPALCNPVDCSLPSSSVQGILQARILEWVAVPFSKGSSQPRDRTQAGLPHCCWILYQLSHKGSPRMLEWVAYTFSRGSSWPKNWTGVSCIAGRFFTTELPGKPDVYTGLHQKLVCRIHHSFGNVAARSQSGDGGTSSHRLPVKPE